MNIQDLEIPHPHERDWRYRVFEILPAVLTWLVLALPLLLGLFSPDIAAVFVIAYMLLWFFRAIGLNMRSLQGNRMMNQHKKLRWDQLNNDLENLKVTMSHSPKWHGENIARVARDQAQRKRVKPSEVIQAVVIAMYKETRDTLEPTMEAVLASEYNPKQVVIVIAYEERGGEDAEKLANWLVKTYQNKFMHIMAVKHPKDTPGEVVGKGGNITYAARRLQKYLESQMIEPRRVLVTTLDADNRPDKKYFGALAYTFCSTDDPKHVSYQPIAMYLNNIWDAPAPMRVIATGNSFWMVIQTLRQHTLRNFSAHAQPMEALIDTGFWSVRTIVEDGHQFWRTYFRYDGKHEVFPIFVPVYQDAVLSDGYVRTLRAQFVQLRRWAWGASDIAYVVKMGYQTKNKLPRVDLLFKTLRLIEGHLSWATAPLIITFAGYLALLFNPESYISNQIPIIASQVMTIALGGILITLFLSLRSLPPKPLRYRRHRTLWMVLQWVYLPVTTIAYSSFAALYSQTRLAFGKYLDKFDFTEKAVKK